MIVTNSFASFRTTTRSCFSIDSSFAFDVSFFAFTVKPSVRVFRALVNSLTSIDDSANVNNASM